MKQGTTRTQIFYVNSFKTHPSTFFSVCHALFFLLFSHAGFYRPENRENSCSRARVENWQWNINKTFRKIVRDITHAHSTSKRHIVIWASFFYVPSNLWRCSSRARDQNKKEKLKTKKREEKKWEEDLTEREMGNRLNQIEQMLTTQDYGFVLSFTMYIRTSRLETIRNNPSKRKRRQKNYWKSDKIGIKLEEKIIGRREHTLWIWIFLIIT